MSRRISLIQIGIGRVGSAVVRLVIDRATRWRTAYDVDVHYYAVADSSALAMPEAGERLADADLARLLAARQAGQRLESAPASLPWSRWEGTLHGALAGTNAPSDLVVVDCANGTTATSLLLAARGAGAHAVLANKDPLAGPFAQYQKLVDGGVGGSLRISATVGAGLPVVTTLAASIASGDTLLEIAARASGSLGFLCDALTEGVSFDSALRQAEVLGYTEPDPRQDLSGLDIARKLLILARVAGGSAALTDVRVESLVPPAAGELALGEFRARLSDYSSHLAERFVAARKADRIVRYVGRIDASGALSAALTDLTASDVLAGGRGPENVFRMRTARYDAHPLIIAGPGAGVEVTAGAVVSDVLRAAGVL